MEKLKYFDQYLSSLILKSLSFFFNQKKKQNKKIINAFVSISNRITSKTEDRTLIHFKLLSEASTDYKFISVIVDRFMPGFYYVIKLFFIIRKYECKILLFDYNFKTRFPNLNLVQMLMRHSPVFCFWLETFDEFSSLVRILPTLEIVDFHIVTDDPTLRIKKYRKSVPFADKFHYFPLPIFPNKMFYDYDSQEKKYDLCFYGNIEESEHRFEREQILKFLGKHGLFVHGFSSKGRHDRGRPSYLEMLNGIRESRIGLNFSNHGRVGAVTNRVIEVIASGAVLLSSNEKVLKELLKPDVEYIYYDDEWDLMKKVQSLLVNEDKLRQVSKLASISISNRYSAENFIKYIESLVN